MYIVEATGDNRVHADTALLPRLFYVVHIGTESFLAAWFDIFFNKISETFFYFFPNLWNYVSKGRDEKKTLLEIFCLSV